MSGVAAARSGHGAGAYIRVGTLDQLKAKGTMVVPGRRCPILVVYHAGKVYALDNRCPHLGFPLHKGSVEDGVLTCHWHHARFDLASGGTFDLWADDVPVGSAEVRDGEVWVAADCGYPFEANYWRGRLKEAMAHNLGLVAAKAVLALFDQGVNPRELVKDAIVFGARNRDGWSTGMTVLTALANVLPWLDAEDRYLALFHGIRRIADDAAGQAPRRERQALDGAAQEPATLKRWLRRWTLVRHRNGGERTLLTAIAGGASSRDLADLVLAAATDRFFADGGHTLDFINKAAECLDLVGWDLADVVLPTIVRDLVAARGEEESNSWRHPVDLVPLLTRAFDDLHAAVARGRAATTLWSDHAGLARALLGDDPAAIVAALDRALGAGATPAALGRTLAYAAALRVAQFGTANEHGDWETAHHAFTYAHALHGALRRVYGEGMAAGRDLAPLRGLYHGAMAVYLERFLNVPPTRLPGTRAGDFEGLPEQAPALTAALLDAMDRQSQVDRAAAIVARYLALGHEPRGIVAALGHALLREDAGFHAFQMFEAGVREFEAWNGAAEGHHVLIAVARYLAAHAPTQRAQHQTADIARRLHRGGALHAAAADD
jgi:nitrite reductase/ring-hydroxylating ferredoxin subunit